MKAAESRIAPRRSVQRRTLALFFALSLGLALVLLSVRASAAPVSFSLTFNGAHIEDPTASEGLRHDGRFTASAPFCSAGRAYDVRQKVELDGFLTVWRLHTCDDGTGGFTAYMPVARGEHGGNGTWQIVEGTGSYATLRGMGTYTGTRLSGDPDNFLSIVYRTQWQGLVDFDADPPVVESFTATAKKLRLKRRTYSLRIAVTTKDPSIPITFRASLSAGGTPLIPDAGKLAATGPGKGLIAVRVSPPPRARSVRIALTMTDALGNTGNASRSVTIR